MGTSVSPCAAAAGQEVCVSRTFGVEQLSQFLGGCDYVVG